MRCEGGGGATADHPAKAREGMTRPGRPAAGPEGVGGGASDPPAGEAACGRNRRMAGGAQGGQIDGVTRETCPMPLDSLATSGPALEAARWAASSSNLQPWRLA